MINYFNYPQTFFTLAVYNINDPYTAFFLTIFIFFSSSVLLNVIKLLYEINLKMVLSVHIFSIFNEALNLLILVFTIIYLDSTNDMDYENFHKDYKSHLPFMAIRKYLIIIISMTMLCIPFRILSLISWCEIISKPFVKYMGVIFRMSPGVLISTIVLGSILYMFSLMNYALYNQYYHQYSTIFDSFLALFNPQIIQEILDYNSGIYFSLMNSPYYVLFNLFQLLIIIAIVMLLSSSFIYLFGQSSSLEEEKIEDEIMSKINEIEWKLTEGKDIIDTDINKLKKQVLWLNLSSKNDMFNLYNTDNELVLFKSSTQIISFLKYLFAIKPELQFKNLYNKFRILIEVKNDKSLLKTNEIEQIESLVDWLMFVGCKIPVIIFSQYTVEKTQKMRINSKFNYISFTTDRTELANFIKEIRNEIVCCQAESLTFNNEPQMKKKFHTSKFKKIQFEKKNQ